MLVFRFRVLLSLFTLILIFVERRDLLCVGQEIPVAHLTLNRRGGAVARREPANLTHLVQLLHGAERRYRRAKREVRGNKLVRKWKAGSTGTTNDQQLLGEPGQDGSWSVKSKRYLQ
jgi:hypothetical protein